MKKQYSKPGIIIEDFRVAQHIASCDGVQHNNTWGSPQQWSSTTCAWKDIYQDNIFLESMTGICVEFADENGQYENLCYNNPEGGLSIFGS